MTARIGVQPAQVRVQPSEDTKSIIRLVVIFFSTLFVGDYLFNEFGATRLGRIVPELSGGILLLVAAVQFAIHRRLDLPPKYLLWFLAFVFVWIAGVIANQVPIGAVSLGIREYLKYAPLFVLPLVYRFSDGQIKVIMLWLLGFALLQLPMTVYQRLWGAKFALSGDEISGTLLITSPLSVFLICVWAVIFAMYLRKFISLPILVLLSIAVLIPTMINETKGSLVILPLALAIPLLLGLDRRMVIPKLFLAGVAFVLLALAYSLAGDILLGERFDRSMIEFFLDPNALKNYLLPSEQGARWVGRFDKLLIAWEDISVDSVKTLLGVGIGNLNDTQMEWFRGDYTDQAREQLIGTGVNQFMWESGLLGLSLAIAVPAMVFLDSYRLSRHADFTGAIANGWGAVAVITIVGMLYIRTSDAQAVSYTFWFMSGFIAQRYYEVRREAYLETGAKAKFNLPQPKISIYSASKASAIRE